MNQSTELNSELLSADARGRKHIPVAVFAVIAIHIFLFVVLLIAAGCRSSARAKAKVPAPAPAQVTHPAEKYMQAATNTEAMPPLATTTEPVAAEPIVPEESNVALLAARAQERQSKSPILAATVSKAAVAPKIRPVVQRQANYVVQSG